MGAQVAYQASIRRDFLGSILAPVWRVTRITSAILFRPANFYANIELGSRAGLKRALFFLAIASSLTAAINLIKLFDLSFDLPAELGGFAILWNTITNNEFLSKILFFVFNIVSCVVWYWCLRLQTGRGKINFMQFLHSVMYPTAAIQIVYILYLIPEELFVLAHPSDIADLPSDYDRDFASIGCRFGSYSCQRALVALQYPMLGYVWLLEIGLLVWWVVAVAIVIKSKTGIKKGDTVRSFFQSYFALSIVIAAAVFGPMLIK